MKKILPILLLFFACISKAQNTDDIGKITLSVVMPDNDVDMEQTQLSLLETKIIYLVTNNGMAAGNNYSNFVVYPKFSIVESKVVEGGMQNIHVTTCELSLFIKQTDNNLIFSTISKELKGSGSSKIASITNAISQIQANDAAFSEFIEKGKRKIIQYYSSKCSEIISKAENNAKANNYESAIALLMTVPVEANECYKLSQNKSLLYFKAYQNEYCSKLIQEAKLLLSAHNYQSALDKLILVDPRTSCNTEAKTIMENVANKIDNKEKKEWDLKVKMIDNNVNLEKARINAIKDIAVAYYKRKPTVIKYNYIIK